MLQTLHAFAPVRAGPSFTALALISSHVEPQAAPGSSKPPFGMSEAPASALGVPGLTIVEGAAPRALTSLPQPNVIFIGGGGSDDGVLDAAIRALPSGGRLVANAVTLEMEAILLRRHAERGGELIRIAVSRAAQVGSMQGWRPAMPVTQWSWVKP